MRNLQRCPACSGCRTRPCSTTNLATVRRRTSLRHGLQRCAAFKPLRHRRVVGHLSPGACAVCNQPFTRLQPVTLNCTWWHFGKQGKLSSPLQSAASFAGVADAVLRMCLRAVGMPGNCLAGVLDDLPPLPDVAPESLLQAASYIGEQLP